MGRQQLNRKDLAQRADLDVQTLASLLDGQRWPQAKTRGRIEAALGWEPGSIAMLRQGMPVQRITVRGDDATTELSAVLGGLTPRDQAVLMAVVKATAQTLREAGQPP